MATPPDGAALRDHADLLHDARVRLAQLEIETHRLRAELARLEAHGEDEAAARLTEQLARQLHQLDDDRRLLEDNRRVGDARPAVAPLDAFDDNQPSGLSAAAGDRAAASPSRAEFPPVVEPSLIGEPLPTTGAGKPKRRRLKSEWVVSLAAHVALGALLGLATFALPIDQPKFLLASVDDGTDNYDDFVEVSLDQIEASEPLAELEPLTESLLDEDHLELVEPVLDSVAIDPNVTPAALLDVLPTDAIGLLSGAPAPTAGKSGRAAKEPRRGGGAQFFGSRSRGDRFVFVVDNSGSMTGGRMETTVFELLRSVGTMSPKQEFHVLFFSDQVYPMFFPEPEEQLVPATRDNRERLQRWLTTVEMCKGDCLADAMDYAAALEPDVVYLLSDGGYLFTGSGANRRPSRKLTHLTEETREWPFTVHTLGMTVRSADSAEGLAMIASAHGGRFTPVGVLPAAAELARQQRVPYNRVPGAVWGSRVRE